MKNICPRVSPPPLGEKEQTIGYAIKSNAIPRVVAKPPVGILKPGEVKEIAVTVDVRLGEEGRRFRSWMRDSTCAV